MSNARQPRAPAGFAQRGPRHDSGGVGGEGPRRYGTFFLAQRRLTLTLGMDRSGYSSGGAGRVAPTRKSRLGSETLVTVRPVSVIVPLATAPSSASQRAFQRRLIKLWVCVTYCVFASSNAAGVRTGGAVLADADAAASGALAAAEEVGEEVEEGTGDKSTSTGTFASPLVAAPEAPGLADPPQDARQPTASTATTVILGLAPARRRNIRRPE